MGKERIFRFKQFIVRHEANAMKVCTEACILGAFAPIEHKKQVLDIGTGTGLLSLMMAQRSSAYITGIELVKEFAEEAQTNVVNSPWRDRISIVNDSFENFASSIPSKFDFILSNPPFYSNQLLSEDTGRNLALHGQSFDHENFISTVGDNILSPEGQICLLLPPAETEFYTKKASESSLFPCRQLWIKIRTEASPFRVITIFERSRPAKILSAQLTIYREGTTYTDEFIELLRPFYTIFE